MPNRCVVGKCSNTPKDGFTLHTFPKDEKTRRMWTRFVQNTRADFKAPSATSVICSGHFTRDCYDPSVELKRKLGISCRLEVLPGKVPTLKLVPTKASEATEQEETVPTREESVTYGAGPSDSGSRTSRPTSTTSSTNVRSSTQQSPTLSLSPEIVGPGPSQRPSASPKPPEDEAGPSKRRRLASEKRARKKTVEQMLETYTKEAESTCTADSQEVEAFEEDLEIILPSQNVTRSAQTEVTVLPRPVKKRSKRLQCHGIGINKGTQTDAYQTVTKTTVESEVQCTLLDSPEDEHQQLEDEHQRVEEGDDDFKESSPVPEDPADVDYKPPSDESPSSDSEMYSSDTEDKKLWEEDKFIVFNSCLLSLFTICLNCYHSTSAAITAIIGTMVSIKQTCSSCSWQRTWHSQPFIRNTPAGNFLLSGAILFAGASPTKTLRVFSHMGCKVHQLRTFFKHQTDFLQPTIVKVWEKMQHQFICQLMSLDKPLILGGDARSDSPGHTAKFGSYTLMELNTNKILNINLVQKNEVSSSNAMELEGLKRTMKWFLEVATMAGLETECIITDRHLQVAKWIRENLACYSIKHYYDVWHIAKSLKKKILAVGKRKQCEAVNDWRKSVINHLYWSASSTPDGNPDLMLEKFLSITNHIQNVHSGHDGTLFRECAHPPLEGDRPRKWLTPSSEACERLCEVLTNTRLQNDVKKMSPKEQTSRLEAFHSLVNFFAPKLTVFSYEGMTCRMLLAAMHYNENSSRDAATTQTGEKRYSIDFPRAKGGEYTLREVQSPATFGYVNDLMEEATQAVQNSVDLRQQISGLQNIPEPVSASFPRPSLEEAVRRQSTRYAPSTASGCDVAGPSTT